MSRRDGSSSTVTLGIRSSQGRHRLQVPTSCSSTSLKSQIKKLLKIDEDFLVRCDKNGRPGDEMKLRAGGNVSSLRLKTGDVLYVTPLAGTRFEDCEDADDEEEKRRTLDEDPVDVELSRIDGLIRQPRTSNCQHEGARSGCIYCAPRDPFDPEYLKNEGIKFLSFHSYLRKIRSAKGKFATLEDINLKIKPGCTSHAPWPDSICSACQPPALTLNRQTYRHVDHIMFENADIVDNFLAFWRSVGCQRMGFLYGRYETFPDVPLGIKAVVCAVYEPPQEGSRDGIKLHEDEARDQVEWIAEQLGLKRIGWIFTDLVSDASGRVKHFRNVDTHFLTAQECVSAGFYQNAHPNATKASPTGRHGSKFVTVVVTGSADGQVHMEGYQVSNQCMALVREKVLVPTRDAPELGYVRESSAEKYVPDVFYKLKDEYGNEVTKVARPLPVEYLLIDVPVATPLEPVFTFASAAKSGFPTENRPMEGHLQDFGALASHRKAFASDHKHLDAFFRDFHLLVYLATQSVHPIDKETLEPLLKALRQEKTEQVYQWAESSHWHTIEMLIQNYHDGYQ